MRYFHQILPSSSQTSACPGIGVPGKILVRVVRLVSGWFSHAVIHPWSSIRFCTPVESPNLFSQRGAIGRLITLNRRHKSMTAPIPNPFPPGNSPICALSWCPPCEHSVISSPCSSNAHCTCYYKSRLWVSLAYTMNVVLSENGSPGREINGHSEWGLTRDSWRGLWAVYWLHDIDKSLAE